VLAALSLLLPSAPTYDPWAWLVWGREIASLELTTASGPVWKPGPVIVTTFLSLAGGAAPALWLVVARTGALFALGLAGWLAWRLTTSEGGRARTAGGAAAVMAVVGLAASDAFVLHGGWGNSEGWLVAFVLLGVDRRLDGHPRQAFACGALAALLRPELVPLVFAHGAALWWRRPDARVLVAAVVVALPALWVIPELLGSGNLLRGADRARQVDPGSFGATDQPALEVLRATARTVPVAVWAGAALAVVLAALDVRRWGRRPGSAGVATRSAAARVAGLLAMAGLGWAAIVACMAGAGFSGAARFLLLTAGLESVAAGAAVGLMVRAVAARAKEAGRESLVGPGTAVTATALAVVIAAPAFGDVRDDLRTLGDEARLLDGLGDAVTTAGGAERLRGCAPASTEPGRSTVTAWYLDLPLDEVKAAPLPPNPRVVVRYSGTSEQAQVGDAVAVRGWRIASSCAVRRPRSA
jgi:hypothetical protein